MRWRGRWAWGREGAPSVVRLTVRLHHIQPVVARRKGLARAALAGRQWAWPRAASVRRRQDGRRRGTRWRWWWRRRRERAPGVSVWKIERREAVTLGVGKPVVCRSEGNAGATFCLPRPSAAAAHAWCVRRWRYRGRCSGDGWCDGYALDTHGEACRGEEGARCRRVAELLCKSARGRDGRVRICKLDGKAEAHARRGDVHSDCAERDTGHGGDPRAE